MIKLGSGKHFQEANAMIFYFLGSGFEKKNAKPQKRLGI